MSGESSALSPAPVIPNRGNGSGVIRERLEAAKLTSVDEAVRKGDSWSKKILAGDSGVRLDDMGPFLAALGLKVVDVSKVCVDRQTAQAYETIAKRAMAKDRTLIWDDAE